MRPGDPTEYAAGTHSFEALAAADAGPPPDVRDRVVRSADALARAGTRAPPPGEDLGAGPAPSGTFWLVIACDVPTSADEVRGTLEATRLEFRSVEEELRALPPALVRRRAGSWAAYYAPAKN